MLASKAFFLNLYFIVNKDTKKRIGKDSMNNKK